MPNTVPCLQAFQNSGRNNLVTRVITGQEREDSKMASFLNLPLNVHICGWTCIDEKKKDDLEKTT